MMKKSVLAVAVAAGASVASTQSVAAVAAATTAITAAQADATEIITLGFAVAGAISALWVVIGIIKKVIKKAAA